MFRIVRTRTLSALHEECARVESATAEALALREDLEDREAAAAVALRQVEKERDEALDEARDARAQVLLDAEDRVALRTLLRIARKQSRVDRVYALLRYGRLHSVHASAEAAEAAAEVEGAPHSGWTSPEPGAAFPPAAEVAWRVQPLPLGGAR